MKYCCPAALTMKYFFDHYEFTSGGALGSLTLGLLVKELWKRGWPPGLSIDKGSQSSQQVIAFYCLRLKKAAWATYPDHAAKNHTSAQMGLEQS